MRASPVQLSSSLRKAGRWTLPGEGTGRSQKCNCGHEIINHSDKRKRKNPPRKQCFVQGTSACMEDGNQKQRPEREKLLRITSEENAPDKLRFSRKY